MKEVSESRDMSENKLILKHPDVSENKEKLKEMMGIDQKEQESA